MSDRPEYRTMTTSQDGLVFVIGPNDERLCEIPPLAHPRDIKLRSRVEREAIATRLAELLNDESDSCHAAADDCHGEGTIG